MNSAKELLINIKICDRQYPMTISVEDEAILRLANKTLHEHINKYKLEFNIEDKQDLLAMVAFDCMVEYIKIKQDKTDKELIYKKLSNISSSLSELFDK
jgi:cell division protein ZapA (FtsZ GTPase activity inhibitor)